MKLKIYNESLFDKPSDAVILSIDGASKGMGGRVARAFERLYPDSWSFIEKQVTYPVQLGFSVPVSIPHNKSYFFEGG